jgi:lysophospholipase L1-like esterase
MIKHYKLTLAGLALLLSAFASATVVNAQLGPNWRRVQPTANSSKVVFVGDYVTAQWASAFASNPNWINQGNPDPLYIGSYAESAPGMLASFQANVVSLHPAVVHLLLGLPDAVQSHDPTYSSTVPAFLTALTSMVEEAKAANIKVVLGLEPNLPNLNTFIVPQINAAIVSFAAANNIPVINYADALCACVNATTRQANVVDVNGNIVNSFQVARNSFQQYGGGPFVEPGSAAIFSASPSLPWDDDFVVTPTGYNLMTQMAESTIDTLNLTLVGGWLLDIEQPDENTEYIQSTGGLLTNINTVTPPSVVQFTPIGYYSDCSQHPMLNSSFQGSSGTWTSSNPLVMTINQLGVAWSISPGTTIIRYTAPNGVAFSEWVMYVTQPNPG